VGLDRVDTGGHDCRPGCCRDSVAGDRPVKGEVEDRSWRIKLTMVKQGSRWLVSQLEFVG